MQLESLKLTEMFQKFLETNLFWGQKVKGQSHIAGVGLCTLVSAGFFQLNRLLISEVDIVVC